MYELDLKTRCFCRSRQCGIFGMYALTYIVAFPNNQKDFGLGCQSI